MGLQRLVFLLGRWGHDRLELQWVLLFQWGQLRRSGQLGRCRLECLVRLLGQLDLLLPWGRWVLYHLEYLVGQLGLLVPLLRWGL